MSGSWKRPKRAAALLLAAVLGAALTGARGASPPAPGGAPADTVGMTNTLEYTPDTLTVRAGDAVLWKNGSALVHTVTGDESKATLEGSADIPEGAEPFDSGRLDPGQTFTHTFETPGEYDYFCVPHEGAKMRGTVIVEPSP